MRMSQLSEGVMFMDKNIVPLENITALVKPLAEKYHVREIYLFGSYARGEADEDCKLHKFRTQKRKLNGFLCRTGGCCFLLFQRIFKHQMAVFETRLLIAFLSD